MKGAEKVRDLVSLLSSSGVHRNQMRTTACLLKVEPASIPLIRRCFQLMQPFSHTVPALKPSLDTFYHLRAVDKMYPVFCMTSSPQGEECLLAFLEVFHDPYHMISREGRSWWASRLLIRTRCHRSFPFFATVLECSRALLCGAVMGLAQALEGVMPLTTSDPWATLQEPLSPPRGTTQPKAGMSERPMKTAWRACSRASSGLSRDSPDRP
jgi:hypothetical protein